MFLLFSINESQFFIPSLVLVLCQTGSRCNQEKVAAVPPEQVAHQFSLAAAQFSHLVCLLITKRGPVHGLLPQQSLQQAPPVT